MDAVPGEQKAQDPVVAMFVKKVKGLRGQLTRLYLFGSRVRENWRPDSDFDLLVVVPRRDQVLVDSLYEAVIDVLLETGALISLKILTQAQYERLSAIPTPFLANVMAEGVELGLDD